MDVITAAVEKMQILEVEINNIATASIAIGGQE